MKTLTLVFVGAITLFGAVGAGDAAAGAFAARAFAGRGT